MNVFFKQAKKHDLFSESVKYCFEIDRRKDVPFSYKKNYDFDRSCWYNFGIIDVDFKLRGKSWSTWIKEQDLMLSPEIAIGSIYLVVHILFLYVKEVLLVRGNI